MRQCYTIQWCSLNTLANKPNKKIPGYFRFSRIRLCLSLCANVAAHNSSFYLGKRGLLVNGLRQKASAATLDTYIILFPGVCLQLLSTLVQHTRKRIKPIKTRRCEELVDNACDADYCATILVATIASRGVDAMTERGWKTHQTAVASKALSKVSNGDSFTWKFASSLLRRLLNLTTLNENMYSFRPEIGWWWQHQTLLACERHSPKR